MAGEDGNGKEHASANSCPFSFCSILFPDYAAVHVHDSWKERGRWRKSCSPLLSISDKQEGLAECVGGSSQAVGERCCPRLTCLLLLLLLLLACEVAPLITDRQQRSITLVSFFAHLDDAALLALIPILSLALYRLMLDANRLTSD